MKNIGKTRSKPRFVERDPLVALNSFQNCPQDVNQQRDLRPVTATQVQNCSARGKAYNSDLLRPRSVSALGHASPCRGAFLVVLV
jgi:hypothetical protein